MSYLSIFVFVAFTLGVISKKQLPSPVSWSFPPVIFLESYGFHIWVFNSFWVNFWMWCTRQGFNFFFFWHVNMQFSHHCWRDCPSLLTGLGIVVKDHLTIYVTVCSWALCFIPLVYLSLCHYHTVWLLWLCSMFFEIRKFESSNFVLFEIIFLFWIPWDSIGILEWIFLGKKKSHWDFDRDYICSVIFPGGSEVKASASNAGDRGSIPGWGRSPEEGNGNPFQYSCWRIPWME